MKLSEIEAILEKKQQQEPPKTIDPHELEEFIRKQQQQQKQDQPETKIDLYEFDRRMQQNRTNSKKMQQPQTRSEVWQRSYGNSSQKSNDNGSFGFIVLCVLFCWLVYHFATTRGKDKRKGTSQKQEVLPIKSEAPQQEPRFQKLFTPETIAQKKGAYLCPTCRQGTLRYISGENGPFWGCNNYPKCKATYDDKNETPVLPMETPKYYDKYDYKEMMVKKWEEKQEEEPITLPKYTKEYIYSLSWRQFEEWVAEVFKQQGYEAYATPPRFDGGKDVVATKDGVKYFIECKHFQTELIGREPLQKLIGAAVGENVHHVIFITTSSYHENAIEYARAVNNARKMTIELWDTDKILEMANK